MTDQVMRDSSVPRKGILKNAPESQEAVEISTAAVRENTAHNAAIGAQAGGGGGGRPAPTSRRQSEGVPTTDDAHTRLKWDEVNLYLAEQQRDSKMKITEPKTPYAPQYNPDEDMDDISDFGGDGQLAGASVSSTGGVGGSGSGSRRGGGLPATLGADRERDDASSVASSARRVIVEPLPDQLPTELSAGGNGEDEKLTPEQLEEKHKEFEQHRKQHYKVPVDVKKLLQQKMDDDEDEEGGVPPPMPSS